VRGLSVPPSRDSAFSKAGAPANYDAWSFNPFAIVPSFGSKNVVQTRPGAHAAVIWTSEGFPVDNDGSADTSGRKIGISTPEITVA
jgi:hypothetical protein